MFLLLWTIIYSGVEISNKSQPRHQALGYKQRAVLYMAGSCGTTEGVTCFIVRHGRIGQQLELIKSWVEYLNIQRNNEVSIPFFHTVKSFYRVERVEE